MRARIAREVPQSTRRTREGMSRLHLERVASLPCLVTGKTGDKIHAHHLMRSVPVGSRGGKMKAPDRYAIPLFWEIHRAVHDSGDDEAYLAERGFDGRAVADALWACRDSIDSMMRVIFRARQDALLKRGDGFV